jgi:hypothetical protein
LITAGNSADPEEWVRLVERREKLEASLGLSVTWTSLLGELGAVVAPVVGAAISFFVRFKS